MIGTWAWGTGMNGSRFVFGKKLDISMALFSLYKSPLE